MPKLSPVSYKVLVCVFERDGFTHTVTNLLGCLGLQGKSCRQMRFMACTAELKAVMIDPPFLPTTKSPIRYRPVTFVAPASSNIGPWSLKAIPNVRRKLVGVVPPSAYITRSNVRVGNSGSLNTTRGRPASSSTCLILEPRSISTSLRSSIAKSASRFCLLSRENCAWRVLSREINKRRGFEPHVLLLELEEIERAIRKNPFPEAASDPRALHAGFLASTPEKPNLKTLESLKSNSERFHLIDKVFYLQAPEGIGRSKLAANAEKLLGVPMTDCNWRTVCKIWEMPKELI